REPVTAHRAEFSDIHELGGNCLRYAYRHSVREYDDSEIRGRKQDARSRTAAYECTGMTEPQPAGFIVSHAGSQTVERCAADWRGERRGPQVWKTRFQQRSLVDDLLAG